MAKKHSLQVWRSIHFIRLTTTCSGCSSFTWNNSLAILVTESNAWVWTVQWTLKFLNRSNSSEAVRWYVHGKNTQPTSLKYTFHTFNDNCSHCSSFTWNNSLAILVTESKAWAWTVQRNLKFLNRSNSSEAVRWYVHGKKTQPTSLKYTFHTFNDNLQSL